MGEPSSRATRSSSHSTCCSLPCSRAIHMCSCRSHFLASGLRLPHPHCPAASLFLPPDQDSTIAHTVDAAGQRLTHTSHEVRAIAARGVHSWQTGDAHDDGTAADSRGGAYAATTATEDCASASEAGDAAGGCSREVAPDSAADGRSAVSQRDARETGRLLEGLLVPSDPSTRVSALIPASDPIVILVDGGTASSAELFAAALRDNGRGVIVGEHTFGKGTRKKCAMRWNATRTHTHTPAPTHRTHSPTALSAAFAQASSSAFSQCQTAAPSS